MEALGISVSGLVAQFVNFILLLLILRAVAYKPIIQMLDERSRRIRESMERAEEVKRQAASTEEEFARRLADARREGQEIIAQAEKIAERLRQDEMDKTRQDLEQLRAKALEDIERERERAVTELRQQVADLALFAAGRVVGRSLDQTSHYRLVDEALAEAEKLKACTRWCQKTREGEPERTMATSGVARRYARAVFDIAREEHDLDGWLHDLRTIRDALQGPEMNALLENPSVTFDEKRQIVEGVVSPRLSPMRRNFVLLLIENRRTSLIDEILAAYEAELNAARGIVTAKVTTAVPLDSEETAAVTRRLENITGQKVEATMSVDPTLIGGFVARIGDRLIDASVVGRLAALRASLMA